MGEQTPLCQGFVDSMADLSLPMGLNLRRAGELQRQILHALNAAGVSYGHIAEAIGGPTASTLRSYAVIDRTPRRTSDTFLKIDAALRGGEGLALAAPRETLDAYLTLFSEPGPVAAFSKDERRASDGACQFDFRLTRHQSPTNLTLLSRALHTAFQCEHDATVQWLTRLEGTYYMYRCSTDPGEIIRSFVSIQVARKHNHLRFTHVHPDRHHGVFLDNRPVVTIGIVVQAGNAVHLLGNAENSGASNFITLRAPQRRDAKILLGFTTVSSERGLVSTRVVLIRDPQAKRDGVTRFAAAQFNADKARFKLSLLEAPGGLAADSSLLISDGPERRGE